MGLPLGPTLDLAGALPRRVLFGVPSSSTLPDATGAGSAAVWCSAVWCAASSPAHPAPPALCAVLLINRFTTSAKLWGTACSKPTGAAPLPLPLQITSIRCNTSEAAAAPGVSAVASASAPSTTAAAAAATAALSSTSQNAAKASSGTGGARVASFTGTNAGTTGMRGGTGGRGACPGALGAGGGGVAAGSTCPTLCLAPDGSSHGASAALLSEAKGARSPPPCRAPGHDAL